MKRYIWFACVCFVLTTYIILALKRTSLPISAADSPIITPTASVLQQWFAPFAEVYHCDDCGMCRRGRAGDYEHCHTCAVCISRNNGGHQCVERSLESNCPICMEYMKTSTKMIVFMCCGHGIHDECLTSYINAHQYKCPICNKTIVEQDPLTAYYDAYTADRPMPSEYDGWTCDILCNDCNKKSRVTYRYDNLLKCAQCHRSYNTDMQLIYTPDNEVATPADHPTKAVITRNQEENNANADAVVYGESGNSQSSQTQSNTQPRAPPLSDPIPTSEPLSANTSMELQTTNQVEEQKCDEDSSSDSTIQQT